MADEHYNKPGWFTRNIFNGIVALATRLGLSVWGSRILQVRGRKTGQVRETPVNLLTHQGETYLVAPRGITQWVRNLRVAGEGTLRLGRHHDSFPRRSSPTAKSSTCFAPICGAGRWKSVCSSTALTPTLLTKNCCASPPTTLCSVSTAPPHSGPRSSASSRGSPSRADLPRLVVFGSHGLEAERRRENGATSFWPLGVAVTSTRPPAL